MNFINKVIAITTIIGALGSTVCTAEEAASVYLNNAKLDANAVQTEENLYMIPLRAVCEKSGYTVTWNEESRTIEITKGAVYITCSPDFDGYTFSKTAPLMLGSAPITVNDTTYVPINFVGDIIMGENSMDGDDIILYEGEDFGKRVKLAEKTEDGLLVSSLFEGDVLLKVNEDTVITDEHGNKLTVDDITGDTELLVKYNDEMTKSVPPQTAANKIVVTNSVNKAQFSGTVKELNEDESGVSILTDSSDIVFCIDNNTVIKDLNGAFISASELKAGTKLTVNASQATTMSIPPRSYAHEILVAE